MRLALILPACLIAAACAPTLNWRELSPPGSGVTLSFPCRPDFGERAASADGPAMGLAHCETGGMGFSLAWADVADAARVAEALQEMPRSLARKLGVAPGERAALAVPGSTPQPEAGQYSLHAGKTRLRLAVFAKGTRVYQAMLQSDSEQTAAWQSFVDGLSLKP
jgi:hypothetical protein